ncbi:DUF6493 family protein, partial [Actinomadura roseirufa]|uniref:DUF6493 family protein n=1 Tax=Actinomadura roseirufa TaxID=2094049 RepID=UPI001040E8CA
MTAWDDLREAIGHGNQGDVTRLVTALDAAERATAAKALPGLLKELLAGTRIGTLEQDVAESLLLAGAGTIGGAAATAAWLRRAELNQHMRWDGYPLLRAQVDAVTAPRSDEWRADVAQRLAARLSTRGDGGPLWHVIARLSQTAGAPLPASDGFVRGWVLIVARPERLQDDPLLDVLVPRLFEVDEIGRMLAANANRTHNKLDKDPWVTSLTALADAGRLDRKTLLDGCVARFLRGGTPYSLRWFVQLHEALEPTGEEAAARVRDYVRLLPSSPPGVAEAALRQVRAADEREALDGPLFEDAAGALLFRPEKKLVRAALTWLDRTARPRGRAEATVRVLTGAFTSDAHDLRERAVAVAVKHADGAGPAVRADVRAAAADLPADLRDPIAGAFGAVDAPAEPIPSAGPPPFVPRGFPEPIGSVSDLGEHIRHGLETDTTELAWDATERLLAAIVEHAHRDPIATRDALDAAISSPDGRYRLDHGALDQYAGEYEWVLSAVRAVTVPGHDTRRRQSLAEAAQKNSRRASELYPIMPLFLRWRMREVPSAVGRTPVLLATPTEGGGHIDPGVLVDRLIRLQDAGVEPGRADLVQALLRVPREIDAAAVTRAGALRSKAGRTVAAWLAEGGLADPEVRCRLTLADAPHALPAAESIVTPPDGVAGDIALVCGLPEGAPIQRSVYYGPVAWWPSILPSHREVTAAHLLPHTVSTLDTWHQGAIALGLAEADGPFGPATAAFLALSLAHSEAGERALAVDALLALGGRGHLAAAELGAAVGDLCAIGGIKLNRVAASLGAAADAGAHADVWT